MGPASIQNLTLNFLCSSVQGRIAGASSTVYEFNSVVRDQHIYKNVWTPLTDKTE